MCACHRSSILMQCLALGEGKDEAGRARERGGPWIVAAWLRHVQKLHAIYSQGRRDGEMASMEAEKQKEGRSATA